MMLHLIDLPTEVQAHSYKYVLLQNECIGKPWPQGKAPTNLLKTCRTIYNIATPIFYGLNTFDLDLTGEIASPAKTLGQHLSYKIFLTLPLSEAPWNYLKRIRLYIDECYTSSHRFMLEAMNICVLFLLVVPRLEHLNIDLSSFAVPELGKVDWTFQHLLVLKGINSLHLNFQTGYEHCDLPSNIQTFLDMTKQSPDDRTVVPGRIYGMLHLMDLLNDAAKLGQLLLHVNCGENALTNFDLSKFQEHYRAILAMEHEVGDD